MITPLRYLKRIVKYLIINRKISVSFYELFPPDGESGDHYYRLDDYYFMFQALGYTVEHYRTNIRNSLVIIAMKK
ncbi:MAG: hypothetical protein B6D58_07695 [candidate division Zixibacteria bacterium 4484_95]|nr:MAG: hypothetical protein B6D58_07695 [candidate division Zixibacteria bacterium 4484_95]